MAEVTHACPPEGESVTPCCGRPPFELPRSDRMTIELHLVTCRDGLINRLVSEVMGQLFDGTVRGNEKLVRVARAAVAHVLDATPAPVYPVTWIDGDVVRNTWSRNRWTGEIQPDPDGDPMYTTTPPPVQ